MHPKQEKTFRVIDGELTVQIRGEVRTLGPGDEIVIRPEDAHSFWNASDREVHYWQEFRPALRSAEFFATLFALAREGELNDQGMPGLMQVALTVPRFRNEIMVLKPPPWMQRMVGILGPVARLTGHESELR